jgi:hypothetical protein
VVQLEGKLKLVLLGGVGTSNDAELQIDLGKKTRF